MPCGWRMLQTANSADAPKSNPVDSGPTAAIEFPHGLPGFESEREFVLAEPPSQSPLLFLQSVRTPALSFLAIPVQTVEPDYELQLNPDDITALGLDPDDLTAVAANLLALALLTVPENAPVTANLLAPVVVNLARSVAVQSVRLDRRYSHCHPLCEAASCS